MDKTRGVEFLIKEVSNQLEKTATKNLKSKLTREFNTKLSGIRKELKEATTGATLKLEVNGEPTGKVEGLKHKKMTDLLKVATQRIPVLLVGGAGTGKTHAAEQVADALGIEFNAMSIGAQTSKSDILGFIHAGGHYVPTLFRKAFEKGGVFLMDEIDAGNSNVLVAINAALANGYCAFPDKMVKRHKDFVFIASANTYGQGASRQYVGRNQLDASTLDRFVIMDWNVDEILERSIVGTDPQAKRWHKVVERVRDYVESEGIRALVTPRATIKGMKLLASGMEFEQVLEGTILGGIPADKTSYIKDIAEKAWGKKTPVTPKPDKEAEPEPIEYDREGVPF